MDKFIQTVVKNPLKAIISAVAALIVIMLFNASVYYMDGTDFVREQKSDGTHEWVTQPGLHFKVPLVTRLTRYAKYYTIDMDDNSNNQADTVSHSVKIAFADTYTGIMSSSWRFALNGNPQFLEKVYEATRSEDVLANTTLLRYAQNLMTYTGNQFTGEDYMQGGQNDFLSRLYYQAANGLYQTQRTKKAITDESGFTSIEAQESGKSAEDNDGEKTSTNYIWVVDILKDGAGNPITNTKDNLLSRLGITIEMISLTQFKPDGDLEQFMSDKKKRIKDRSKTIEDQRNEREKAITARLTGERERIEARSEKLKLKDAAIIAEEQKVEVERQQAELSKVQKDKELSIARANEGIQKANLASAKYEAQAILETGLAEAEVSAAKYKALNNPVYLRELEKAQAEALYRVLPNVPAVTMPTIMNVSADGKGGSGSQGLAENLANMSSLYLMNSLNSKMTSGETAKK